MALTFGARYEVTCFYTGFAFVGDYVKDTAINGVAYHLFQTSPDQEHDSFAFAAQDLSVFKITQKDRKARTAILCCKGAFRGNCSRECVLALLGEEPVVYTSIHEAAKILKDSSTLMYWRNASDTGNEFAVLEKWWQIDFTSLHSYFKMVSHTNPHTILPLDINPAFVRVNMHTLNLCTEWQEYLELDKAVRAGCISEPAELLYNTLYGEDGFSFSVVLQMQKDENGHRDLFTNFIKAVGKAESEEDLKSVLATHLEDLRGPLLDQPKLGTETARRV